MSPGPKKVKKVILLEWEGSGVLTLLFTEFGEFREEGFGQPFILGLFALDSWGQLLVVSREDELLGKEDGDP